MVSQSDDLTTEPSPVSTLDELLTQRLIALLPKDLGVEPDLVPKITIDPRDLADTQPSEALRLDATVPPPPIVAWHFLPAVSGELSKASQEGLDTLLHHWHEGLPTDAHLLVAVPLTRDEDADSAAGNLPSRQQLVLRQVIRLLSERGFAIRKETVYSSCDPDPQQPERSWQLISSRKDPFRIRSYEEGDEDAILDLFPTCFHVQRGEDHWRWKYRNNPFGDTTISLALSPQKELGAHYAGYAMPLYYQLDGKPRTFPVLQMGDTMTNPVFRHAGRGRNGLLARTVRHFFSLRRGGPYGFFYGFNTGAIQRFCGWFIGGSKVEPVGFWCCDQETPPATWSVKGYAVEPLTRAEGELNRLFRKAAPHYGFLVQRDARYLQWRYLSCPDTEYTVLAIRRWRRLVGWGVFRRHEDRLIWGDALIHPRHCRSAGPLLAAARHHLADGEPLPIDAWFSRGPEWWASRLPGLGFSRRPQPQKLGFMALPDGEPGATEHLPDLYYTMGDGDLF